MSERAAQMREEIAAMASQHDEDCECLLCLAAGGDEDALSAMEAQMAIRPQDEAMRDA